MIFTAPKGAPMEVRMDAVEHSVRGLQGMAVREKQVQGWVRGCIAGEFRREADRLEKLRDDCVRVLTLLKSKGIVTQAEINEATDG